MGYGKVLRYLDPAPKANNLAMFEFCAINAPRYAVARGELIWVCITAPVNSKSLSNLQNTAGPKQKERS